MSRIGKQPIMLPKEVTATVADKAIRVRGPKGELIRIIHPDIDILVGDNEILIKPARVSKKAGALWGLTRSLIANMVRGVQEEYKKELEFEGIGFRAVVEGNDLVLQLGFSHPVRFIPPQGVEISVQKSLISVTGINKEMVGQTAARIRALKPPEPYKGKGIRYRGEVIRRKAGKKAVSTG